MSIVSRFTVFASATAVLAGLGVACLSVPAQATTDPVVAAQISSYQLEMAELSSQGDAQASETLGQFNALSGGEKERFVRVINDPDIYKQIFELAEQVSDPGTQSVTTLADGDLVVENESTVGFGQAGGPDLARVTTVTRWAAHRSTDKLLGVKIASTMVKTNYQTRGKDTTKILPGDAEKYVFIPGCKLSRTPVEEWNSALDNAQSETIWTADCPTAQWDGRQRVWGDWKGYLGGYLKVYR